ncbi:hypothetical protein ACHAPJ_013295 [Fusarium lateritium]
MPRAILITGATGKQGGAVLEALLPTDFLLLAVTRTSQSASAQRLISKSQSIRLVQGNLDDAPALFDVAKAVVGPTPIWGVYSVQAAMGKGYTEENETRQGKALIDESIANGVKHFVYSSVDRGGELESWNSPTTIPHFRAKHNIERHLRESAARVFPSMSWTILRPVSFMDSFLPGFIGKVFMTMIRDTMGQKRMQYIAVSDIGFFAACAFTTPAQWTSRAISLAGDELTFDELNKAFVEATGREIETTFGFLGAALKYGVPEIRDMVTWVKEVGYKADIAELRKIHPDLMTVTSYLRQKSQTSGSS